MVEEFCDRAIWLNKGVLRMQGQPSDVIKAYKDSLDLNQALMADAVANF
jgi:ABC-type polysaccharide/polyol phosphate transport system ATPase subunit